MKKALSYITWIIISFTFITNVNALEVDFHSKNAVLYNLKEDTILLEKDKSEQIPIASMTKIMTTIVALEHIDNLDKQITMTNEMFIGLVEANAAVVGFYPGEKLTLRDLLYGTLLVSGADATRGLAITLAGSEAKFVEWMNEKAEQLNLKNTHFVNTTGLDIKNHYSSVEDVATILKYALKNKEFKTIFQNKTYRSSDNYITMHSTLKKAIDNYNLDIDYIKGAKTGYTDDAGLCLASIATYDGVDYLLVTARAPYSKTTPYHMLDAKKIYEYYFKNYKYHNIIEKNDNLVTLKTVNTKEESVTITSQTTISKYLNNTFDKTKVELKYEGIDNLTSKTKVGTKLGKIDIIYENDTLASLDIILQEPLHFSLGKYLKNNIVIVIIGGMICITIITLIIRKVL